MLAALYQPFGFAIILSVLFMFLYLYAKEHGWKGAFRKWWDAFRGNLTFRKTFCLAFYTALILFRTLIDRKLWANPLSDVFGGWGLYNKKGELTTEAIENVILFIPFIVLLLWSFREKIVGTEVRLLRVLWQALRIAFAFSLSIEFLQLFLCMGTFQLADIFYNTLGGVIGGFIYWVGYRIGNRKNMR